VITNMVYTIVDHFSRSDVVELAYSTAFTEFNYGLSAVFSIISTVVTLLILALLVRAIQKNTFYYN
nr:sugar ABC transporter permease [Acetatifactor sp.]